MTAKFENSLYLYFDLNLDLLGKTQDLMWPKQKAFCTAMHYEVGEQNHFFPSVCDGLCILTDMDSLDGYMRLLMDFCVIMQDPSGSAASICSGLAVL